LKQAAISIPALGGLAGLHPPTGTRAKPFLKWAGGKTQLLKTFVEFFPASYNRYFEPFVGSGAVFFHLRPEVAHLSDCSVELINCYSVVRDEVAALIKLLKKHKYEEEYFYNMRAMNPENLTPAERAARFIFLNKTCFNGLYRVNSRGQFNVPFGRYKNPLICDQENLLAVSRALKKVSLRCNGFEKTISQAKKGDFLYLDPPYQPLSATANFTSYTKDSFSLTDQKRLAESVRQLSKRGCTFMLSNSDCQEIRELYAGFHIETIQATRAINCKSERRGTVTELLILNY
jgi:DNA adenine methylase